VDTTTQGLTIVIILLAMVVSVVVTQFIRRRRDLYALREIRAYGALPRMVGEAIEANRTVHVALASSGLGAENTLLALANAELFYQVLRRTVIGTTAPIFSVSEASAVPLAQDTLRRAYESRNLIQHYRVGSVRWYPGGTRSLAFAAALTTTVNEQVGTNVLGGSFGAELALVTGAAARANQNVIATSDQLEGQAIAYVMSDEVLIGEEVFAGGAYLGGSAAQVAGVVTTDVLRWLLILGLLVVVADGLSGGVFSRFLGSLLGGG